MEEFKTFVYLMLTLFGVAFLAVVIWVLGPYLTLISWLLVSAIGATGIGLSVRFLVLPILNGSLALFDRIADICIKVSDHLAQKKLAERTIPVDNNGNAIVYGIDPRLIVQLQGQYQQPVPSSIHWNYRGLEGKQGEPLAIEAPKESIPAVVRYDDIADQIPDELSLLGIHPDTGHLEICSPERYKTAWFVGGSNTGKTNTVYGKVADAVRWGAQLIICDPHAHKPDSLTNKLKDFHHALLMPVAQSDPDILNALTAFLNEFKTRRDGGKDCTQQVLIVVDEVNGLARHVVRVNGKEVKMLSSLQELAETCGYEARGFQMFGFFISQKVAGLSWLRNAMMTVFVHGLLMESEATLAANNDRTMAKQVMGFKTGRTLVYGYEFEPTILQQPKYEMLKQEHPNTYQNTTLAPSEIPSIASSINSTIESTVQSDGDSMDGVFDGDVLKLKKVRRLLTQEKTQQEVVCEIWGVKPNTRAFNEALIEYRKMLAFLADESEA